MVEQSRTEKVAVKFAPDMLARIRDRAVIEHRTLQGQIVHYCAQSLNQNETLYSKGKAAQGRGIRGHLGTGESEGKGIAGHSGVAGGQLPLPGTIGPVAAKRRVG